MKNGVGYRKIAYNKAHQVKLGRSIRCFAPPITPLCAALLSASSKDWGMEFTKRQVHRSSNPISGFQRFVWLAASVPSAFVRTTDVARVNCSASSAASVRLKPSHALRQRGCRASFFGAAITRKGIGRFHRRCFWR